MNEQIKELMGQTLDEKFAGTWTTMDLQDLRKFADKFAELIVRECINCTKEWRDAVRVGSDRDYSRGYVHGCDDAIVEMKTRFGVEE